jgi:hypothetical protein
MTRTEIINSFIQKYGYKTYLEIGVNTSSQPGYNWDSIHIDLKHGVDPEPKVHATFPVPSDDFFAQHITMKYDIVFVDGLHIFEQAYRDIVNSLKNLNENGTIVVHDCNPVSEKSQSREHTAGIWQGDVWKAILKLRTENPELSIYTIDSDFGCAVIRKGSQEVFKSSVPEAEMYTYPFLVKNRKEILKLISVREFKKIIGIDTWFTKLLKKIKS